MVMKHLYAPRASMFQVDRDWDTQLASGKSGRMIAGNTRSELIG